MATVEILDNLYLNGEQVTGAFKTSSDGLYAIDSDVLKELIARSKKCSELEKSSGYMLSMIQSGKMASNGQRNEKTPGEMLGELSAKVRTAKKRQAVAVCLSLSIQGYYPYKIAEVLEERGLSCSDASISRALSVLKDEDKSRLWGIFESFPEEFSGLTAEDFETWFSNRYADAKKAADKRERNRRRREAFSEWGE